jgi:TolB-like protein
MAQTDEQLWVLAGLGFVALVLLLVVRHLARGKPEPLPATGPLRLLIRPLKELRPDPNHLYLGNTIARELSVALKGFDRMEPSVGDAASGLSIDGTVRKTGPRLLITIRLLSGRHPLWTGTYDGAINDLARMEGEIVSNVARALKLVARKAPATADAPVNP